MPIVALAVLVTGGATAFAMAKTDLRGPQTSWGTVEGAVDQLWTDQANAQAMPAYPAAPGAPMMQPTAPVQDPALPAPIDPAQTGARPVAGLPGVPAIMWGTPRPHADRGACAHSHTVLDRDGAPIPSIFSFSSMPHGFRGACSNCHQITVATGLSGRGVAAMVVPPSSAPSQPMPSWSAPSASAWAAPSAVAPSAPPSWAAPNAVAPSAVAPSAPPSWAAPSAPPSWAAPNAVAPSAPPAWAAPSAPPSWAAPNPSSPWGAPTATAPPATGPGWAQPAAPVVPNEAEWQGMEVRPGAQGVVVTKADGTAARMGVQPGDFVASINGQSVRNMGDFVAATQNGRLAQGTMIASRGDQRVAFELIPTPENNGGVGQMGMGQMGMNPTGMGQMGMGPMGMGP